MNNSKKIFVSMFLVLSVLMVAVASVGAANSEKTEAINAAKASFSDLYEQVNPSVVYILVAKEADSGIQDNGSPFNFDFGEIFGPEIQKYFEDNNENIIPQDEDEPESEPQKTYGSGTGFVWDNQGHIVTNNHVIEDAVEITVTYSDGIQRDAVLVGTDPDSDLAVIKVEDFEDVEPVSMGDSTALKPGDLAAAIGNPFGNTGTMTQGIISALGRSYSVENGDENGNYSIPDVIQTDAAINPGNSGGVLINVDGEVVGVVMAFSSASYSSAGIGYAIPSALVKRVVPKLISDGSYQHPWIGISGIALTPQINEALELDHDMRGAYVQSVQENSPAKAGGIAAGTGKLELGEGASITEGSDIITLIDGEPVEGMDDIIAYLSSHTSVGDTITLHVIRDGKEMDVDITLAARPTASERTAAADAEEVAKAEGSAYLGAYVIDVNDDLVQVMDLPEGTKGALVTQVTADSPADDADLIASDKTTEVNGVTVNYGGDIITKLGDASIDGVQSLKAEIAKHMPGERVTLTILRDGEEQEIRLTLGNTLSR